MKAIWAHNTPYSKFLLTVGVILISAVFFTLLGSVVLTSLMGISMERVRELMADPNQPEALGVLRMIQTLSAIGAFVIPPFILGWLFDGRPANYLSLDKSSKPGSFLIVAALMIAALPAINFLGELNSHLHLPEFLKGLEDWMKESEQKAAELTEIFLQMNNVGELLFNLFMIALIPAIGEELVFRGVIQKIFQQWSKNIHVSIWTTAFLFSAVHMQFYGFLPRMLLGGMFGYMLVWSGSMWVPIVAHFVNNAGAVIMMYLFQNELSSVNPDEVGTGSDFQSVIFSLVVTVVLFGILYRGSKKKKENIDTVNL